MKNGAVDLRRVLNCDEAKVQVQVCRGSWIVFDLLEACELTSQGKIRNGIKGFQGKKE